MERWREGEREREGQNDSHQFKRELSYSPGQSVIERLLMDR